MEDIILASIVIIVLVTFVSRSGYNTYRLGRFIVIALYLLSGLGFEALAVGVVLQAMKIEESLVAALLVIVGVALSAVGFKFLKETFSSFHY